MLQQNISDNSVIISNFYIDYIGSNFTEISLIISATQSFSYDWVGFVEVQGAFQSQQNNINLGLGLSYLLNKDIQFGTSARVIKENQSVGFFGNLSLSYRIDRSLLSKTGR